MWCTRLPLCAFTFWPGSEIECVKAKKCTYTHKKNDCMSLEQQDHRSKKNILKSFRVFLHFVICKGFRKKETGGVEGKGRKRWNGRDQRSQKEETKGDEGKGRDRSKNMKEGKDWDGFKMEGTKGVDGKRFEHKRWELVEGKTRNQLKWGDKWKDQNGLEGMNKSSWRLFTFKWKVQNELKRRDESSWRERMRLVEIEGLKGVEGKGREGTEGGPEGVKRKNWNQVKG